MSSILDCARELAVKEKTVERPNLIGEVVVLCMIPFFIGISGSQLAARVER